MGVYKSYDGRVTYSEVKNSSGVGSVSPSYLESVTSSDSDKCGYSLSSIWSDDSASYRCWFVSMVC